MKSAKGWVCFLILGLSIGCQRSAQFRRDEEIGKGEVTPTYYNDASQAQSQRSATDRIEAMGQPKKKVLVFNFWNNTPVSQKNLGEFAADQLRRRLFLTQRLLLPTEIKTSLSTEDFIQGDQIRVAQLIREGRRLGLAALVIGRITKIVFRQRGDDVGLFRQKQSLAAVEVEMKLFDVQSGREVMASAKSGEASNNSITVTESSGIESAAYRNELTQFAIREAVSGFVPDVIKAIEKMTWQGHIAQVKGKKVFVNAGRASGLILGDILRVLSNGDEVYDPITGAYLGRAQGQIKGTLEVVDFLGTDGAVSEIHTGGNFREGDLVQLY